jgi:hypothetical protein
MAAKNQDVSGRFLEEIPSEEHFEEIQGLVNACLEHPKCVETASGTEKFDPRDAPLPTRCIEITSKKIALKETAGLRGAYLALSHRWNEESAGCKTTTENYEARKLGREFGSLPKLFQDAVVVAQKLGIRYLWIDSICIIQSGDNGQDWSKEALNMAQYFQKALLTVASTVVTTRDGLFCTRTRNLPESIVQLPYRGSDGRRRGSFYVYRRELPLHVDFWSSVRKSELFNRGWVFQEWILSRRILVFTPSGAFFECQSEYPRNIEGETIHAKAVSDNPLLEIDLKMSLHHTESPYTHIWYRIIERYSILQLTMPEKDRILAVSGVAKEYREMRLLREAQRKGPATAIFPYISGLWVHDIHYGLLWERRKPRRKHQRTCTAPSWSWASHLLEVRWADRSRMSVRACEVLGLVSSEGDTLPMQDLGGGGSWRTAFMSSGSESVAAISKQYDVDNMFTCLLINGRLQPVLIRDYFETKELRDQMGSATGHEPSFGRKGWRGVCSLNSPEEVGGWASLEAPELQDQMSSYDGTSVLALHISTRKWGGVEGFALGSLIPRNDVFDVLFLKDAGDGSYQRLGVGRLFEPELLRGFQSATDQVIKLM